MPGGNLKDVFRKYLVYIYMAADMDVGIISICVVVDAKYVHEITQYIA